MPTGSRIYGWGGGVIPLKYLPQGKPPLKYETYVVHFSISDTVSYAKYKMSITDNMEYKIA
jgi:hypothetical protein